MDYAAHVRHVLAELERILADCARDGDGDFDGIVFHSGSRGYYHRRDREQPFVVDPHFARLSPLAEPDALLIVRPGRRARLIRTAPDDYWHSASAPPPPEWAAPFELEQYASARESLQRAGSCAGLCFVGERAQHAQALSIAPDAVEPEALIARLDWSRSTKTAYEQQRICLAGERAARGHAVVARMAQQGRSERALHAAYLAATDQLEHDTPYTNIIAWDAHSATLHHADKSPRLPEPGAVLLIDAGAAVDGYASDITRTHVLPAAHPVFVALRNGMVSLQRELVERVRPGLDFVELHRAAEQGVCKLLSSTGVARCDPDTAHEAGLGGYFMPHGLGHFLGLQVHDVAGHQLEERGGRREPPSDLSYLRTTRTLAADQVITIEPGLYFIEQLMARLRRSGSRDLIDWKLVDALLCHGGIRVEDDVLVTCSGSRNLTASAVDQALEQHAFAGPPANQPGYS